MDVIFVSNQYMSPLRVIFLNDPSLWAIPLITVGSVRWSLFDYCRGGAKPPEHLAANCGGSAKQLEPSACSTAAVPAILLCGQLSKLPPYIQSCHPTRVPRQVLPSHRALQLHPQPRPPRTRIPPEPVLPDRWGMSTTKSCPYLHTQASLIRDIWRVPGVLWCDLLEKGCLDLSWSLQCLIWVSWTPHLRCPTYPALGSFWSWTRCQTQL